jgi:hypothetical protein
MNIGDKVFILKKGVECNIPLKSGYTIIKGTVMSYSNSTIVIKTITEENEFLLLPVNISEVHTEFNKALETLHELLNPPVNNTITNKVE